MKDLLIILLLLGLLWGGYQGMVFLGSFAQSATSTSESIEQPLAEHSEKRLNQSAIAALKKTTPSVKEKETPVIKKTEVVPPAKEKTNGQKAMEAVRGDTRLDIEGKPRSKEDFYKESNNEESAPYERKNDPVVKKTPTTTANETDLKEQKAAMAEKGKALAGEFNTKGNSAKKSNTKTAFNIEKGEHEPVSAPDRPQEYESQPIKKFTPSKFVLVAGSYSSADNAVKEVLRLKKQGYPKASIVLSEKNLNLVSLGTFSDRATADAQAAQIKKAGIDLFVKGMR